ncbi:MAG: CopD family protein, partial [Hydrogenophaga sp.]
MIYATLKLLHILSIVVWVGGMVFAHFFLRPAALQLEAPERVRLMHAALQRFFAAVLAAVGVVLASGLWMIGRVAKETVQAGLDFNMPLNWTLMTVLGLVMMGIFGHIRFALFKRLGKAVAASRAVLFVFIAFNEIFRAYTVRTRFLFYRDMFSNRSLNLAVPLAA